MKYDNYVQNVPNSAPKLGQPNANKLYFDTSCISSVVESTMTLGGGIQVQLEESIVLVKGV